MDTQEMTNFRRNIRTKTTVELLEMFENIIAAARILVDCRYFDKYIGGILIQLVFTGGIVHVVSKYADEMGAGITRNTPIDQHVLKVIEQWKNDTTNKGVKTNG